MDRERFEKQLNFILEIDKEKQILRQTHIRGYSRQEDDAEHAWHMAVMAFLLQEYSNEKIDIGRTMLMLLIHDLVEIDAGDTYAYDAEANKTKDEREHKAAERIYGLLPEDQGKMLICAMREGDFTAGGHFIVIYGYDKSGFYVNDSNCVARSRRQWTFAEIGKQIKCIWAYGKTSGTMAAENNR